ncbi:MAG: hypothetical protein PHC50_01615 [Candidatus Cloacimonetes bacterium]|nr:hypothetical protein [Candidatus Cloacimonadota bacterium]
MSIRDKVNSAFEIEVKSTMHFIELIQAGKTPDRMMINTHPQRWDDNYLWWLKELVAQNLKNKIKQLLNTIRSK